jgi:DNA-binding response OmpR family regulator
LLIAVTAFGGLCPEAAAREAGFDHYLTKPADPLAVEALIQTRARREQPPPACSSATP